ncbi:5'-3' exonuclease H3TH domain-containing protein [Cellulomonas cellasea]|uniref:5'-3' exonuclease n=1 Tax=Cellulomonas cellasea TaxID=43670 RepID=UPI0025A34CCC|nr:5'-3' exonuclease H3TH domain-containing protein [Cellulomonas cellasea]MDM8083937.1 5'-3' exonuclease H3TH domain-containing protein [Cellulomonas cellasea]
MTATPTLLAVDGNSLVHRSFHALLGTQLTTRDGRPTWAVKGFVSQLLGAVDRIGAHALVVGFDDHTSSARKAAHPHYKATRGPKAPELVHQLQMTADLLRDAGITVVVPDGLEADDVVASAAAQARAAGWSTVVVTSDRDSFGLIDTSTSVLRVINGGIDASPVLTPERLTTMIGIEPGQYRQYAALRGDASDNLTGVRGIGEKTATKLLNAFGSVEAALADIDTNGGARVAAEVGKAVVAKLSSAEAREAFWQNVEIMTMSTDIPLGLDWEQPGAGRLPLDHGRVTAALAALELTSLIGYAGRVLCHAGEPAAPVAREPWAAVADVPDGPEPCSRDEEELAPHDAELAAAAVAAEAPQPAAADTWTADTLF